MSDQGGADGTPAGAPSGAAKEKMRAAAAGVGGVLKSLASTFGLDVKRASVADLTRVHATDSERAAQAAQTPPVTDAGAHHQRGPRPRLLSRRGDVPGISG